MFNLSAKSRARVLLIEANGVTLLRWQRGSLRLFAQYSQSQSDLARFENLLHTEAKVPFIIVLDCIEEDFRLENFAHVTGSDRTKMLERKLAFAFRNTPYKIARVVGREKDGRKDDRVLLTALTKADLVDPWITRILKEKLAVLCVTSAAYMMELLAVSLQLKSKPHVLLVNIEAGTGMRQTYLQKGRVIFSRLTPISERQQDDMHGMLQQQSIQTRKYLERIKQIPYDVQLPVYVLSLREPGFDTAVSPEGELLSFQLRQVESLVPADSLQLGDKAPGPLAVSLVQALRGRGLKNVYAQRSQRRFHFLNNSSKAMYTTAAAIVLSLIVVVAPTISQSVSLWEQEAGTLLRTQPLLQQYEQLRASFPETPIESSTMALVVETHDLILSQAHAPQEVLQHVGQALTRVPSLELVAIDWELQPRPLTEEELLSVTVDLDNPGAPLRDALLAGRTQLLTTVVGNVRGAPDFRSARSDVLSFIEALEEKDGVRINQLEMPVDIRTDEGLATVINDETVNEAFLIEIVKSLETAEQP